MGIQKLKNLRHLHFFAVVLSLFLGGCNPAFMEGHESISGAPGFFYSDSGGEGNMILLEDNNGKKHAIIEPRVNGYLVKNGKLLVSRSRATSTVDTTGKFLSTEIEKKCEFYSIDVKTKVVTREYGLIEGLRCSSEKELHKTI